MASSILNLSTILSGRSGLYLLDTVETPVTFDGTRWRDQAGRGFENGKWVEGLPSLPVLTVPNTFSVPENTPFSLSLTASQAVTWAKTGGADAALFGLSGSTLTLPARDFEIPTDAGGDNTYVVELTATATATGLSAKFVITGTVTDVMDTVVPLEITSSGTSMIAENTAFSRTLTANRSGVTWAKTGGADAALFGLSGSTLTLAARDFEVPTDAGGDNTYVVQITATDPATNTTASQTLSVTVTNVLEGTLATITPTTGTVAAADAASKVVLDLPALVEGESRSYIVTTGPAFPFNTAGDLIRGVDVWSAAGTGTGKVRQTRNGVNTDTDVSIALSVASSFAFTSTNAGTVAENADFTLTLATNRTGVTFAKAGGADAALFALSGATLTLAKKDFEVPTDAGADNTYVVQLTATDPATNETASQTLTVTVTNVLEGAFPALATVAAMLVTVPAGTVVIEGAPLVEGETRDLTPKDGRFVMSSTGKIVRGLSAVSLDNPFVGTQTQTRPDGTSKTTPITITIMPPPVTTAASKRVALPADFGWTPPFAVSQRLDGVYGHDFNIDLVKPAYTTTIHVGLGGDNTKDGLTPANKIRSWSLAATKANAAGSGGQFVRILYDAGYYFQSSVVGGYPDSLAGTTLSGNVILECSTPVQGAYSISDRVVPAFVPTATDATVHASPLGSVTVGQCAIDMSRLDKNGMWPALRRCFPAATDEATIVAAINAKAAAHGDGAFYYDTTNKKFYVKLAAGRAPDANLIVMSDTAANLEWKPANGAARTIWISPDIKICGGNNPVRFVSNTTAGVDLKVYVKGSTSAYSGTGHAFSFSGGPGFCVLDRPEAHYCAQDGLNYTGVAGSGSWQGLESYARIFVTGLNNEGDGSNNGSSCHKDCKLFRLLNVYEEGTNRAVHDIENAYTLNFGLDVRANRTAGNGQAWDASYCVGYPGLAGNAKMYLYGCKSAAAHTYDIQAYDGGQAFYADMLPGDTVVSGTGSAITPFTVQFATFAIPSDAVILDPAAGKTLQANWADAVDGKVLVLKAGNHGKPNITRANAARVTVYSEPGAFTEKLDFSGSASRWRFLDPKVIGEGIGGGLVPQIMAPEAGVNATYPTVTSKYLISIGVGTSYIELDGLSVSSTDDTSTWVEKDWAYRPYLIAVDVSGTFCSVINSHVYNCRRAVNLIGSDALIRNNLIEEYGVDGLDTKANRVRILDNVIRNSRRYDAEPLHTDGGQGYGQDGSLDEWVDTDFSGNTVIEGPYQTGLGLNNMQGFSIFDGIFKGVRVKDCFFSVNSFHGLTLKGVDNVEIVRNTMTKYSAANGNVPWCLISLSKGGGGLRSPGKTKIAGNVFSDLKVFQPGIWGWVFAEGKDGVAGQTTLTFSAPPGGTPVATGTPNLRASTNANGQTTFAGGITGVVMGERAIDVYDPLPAAPPTVTVGGPGTGHDVRASVVPTSYYKDSRGVVQIQANKKPGGADWGVPFSTL